MGLLFGPLHGKLDQLLKGRDPVGLGHVGQGLSDQRGVFRFDDDVTISASLHVQQVENVLAQQGAGGRIHQVAPEVFLVVGKEAGRSPGRIVIAARSVGSRRSKSPVRQHASTPAAKSFVGILVEKHLHAFPAGLLDQQSVYGGVSPSRRTLSLDVASHHSNAGLAPDPDGLLHPVGSGQSPPDVQYAGGLPQGQRGLAALVGIIKTIVIGDHPGQFHDLLSGAESARTVLRSGAEAPAAGFHSLANQGLHALDLLCGGSPLVVVPHDLAADGSVPDHEHDVECGSRVSVSCDLIADGPDRIASVSSPPQWW